MDGSGFVSRVKARARQAVEGVMASERGAAAVTEALRRMQQGRDKAEQMVGALGLATRADLERVGRKAGKLRKRIQGLLDDLERRG